MNKVLYLDIIKAAVISKAWQSITHLKNPEIEKTIKHHVYNFSWIWVIIMINYVIWS